MVLTLNVQNANQGMIIIGRNQLKEHPRVQKVLEIWGNHDVSIQCYNMDDKSKTAGRVDSLENWSIEFTPPKGLSKSRFLVLLQKSGG